MFWRGCGLDTGNLRIYLLSDHRLANWGGDFIMLHYFPVFFFSLCVDDSLTQGQMSEPLAHLVLPPGWMSGWPELHFLLLEIIEVTSEGYSSTPGSLLNLSPNVSSALTRGSLCPCALSPCIISAWCWWSLLEKCSHCVPVMGQKDWYVSGPDLCFSSAILWWALWLACRLRCHRVGEV